MRTVRIIRPSRPIAAMSALYAYVGNQRKAAAKLSNGSEIILELDESQHEIILRGGLFSPRDFSTKLNIPTGRYSYTFQLDLAEYSHESHFRPVLRPIRKYAQKDEVRTKLLIGTAVTELLLNEEFRYLLRKYTNVLIDLQLLAEKWQLSVLTETKRIVMLDKPYASRDKGKTVVTAMAAASDLEPVLTAGHRAATEEDLFLHMFSALPDYERIGKTSLRFVETPT